MQLSEIITKLDDELRTDDFADLDASANGLQVGPEETEIEHVAFAVDAVEQTITEAANENADLLVAHHGIVWGGLDRLTGRPYDRIAPLVENDLALYVSHLPLDAHPELGNAAGLADLLDLGEREPFAEIGPEQIGVRGTARDAYSVEDLRELLETRLDHGQRSSGQSVQVLPFGPDEIRNIAVVTGSGVDWLDEAEQQGIDALVTGEGKGKTYHEAREAGLHVFLAGHYATETFGVQSLQDLAEEWGLETTFLDVPTGL